jgi:hypothetical protein
VTSVFFASFLGSIVTMVLAFSLKSGRRMAVAAYAIFAAETGLFAMVSLLFGRVVPMAVVAPLLVLLGILAYVTRPPRRLLPYPDLGVETIPSGTQAGRWPPGGSNPFDGDKPKGD